MLRRSVQILVAIAALSALLGLVQFLPRPAPTRFWDTAYDAGHILVFGLFTLVGLKITAVCFGDRRVAYQYASVGIFSIVTGLLVELWQKYHGRAAEWIDVFSDGVGILAFAAFYACYDQRIRLPRPWLLQQRPLLLSAGVLVCLGLIPLAKMSERYIHRRASLPRLVDYRRPGLGIFCYTQHAEFSVLPRPTDWPDSEQKDPVARFDAGPGRYCGFFISEAYPDWSNYTQLEMEVFFDEDVPRDFYFRIHDVSHNHATHDRFRRRFKIEPGYQKIMIDLEDVRRARKDHDPKARDLDLRHIHGMAFFTTNLSEQITFYLGRITLLD